MDEVSRFDPTQTQVPAETAETADTETAETAWSSASANPQRMADPDEQAPSLEDYAAIGEADANGAGTITYQTKDGDNVLVSQSTNPALYDQVSSDAQTLATVAESAEFGFSLAGSDQDAPALTDYASIEAPDQMGEGTIRYETNDGDKVIVSQQNNPDLYDQVSADYQSLTAINDAGEYGYDLADADASLPADLDVSSITEHDNGVVTYDTDGGDKVAVSEDISPDLYNQLSQLSEQKDAIANSEADNYTLAAADTQAPALGDYERIGYPDEVGDGLIRYETKDGGKVVVSEATNPELYDQVSADYEKLSTLNQLADDGYGTAGGSDAIKDGVDPASITDQGGGVLTYETEGGDKVAVSQDLSPDLYDDLSALSGQADTLQTYEDAGYTMASADTAAPSLAEYKGIHPPEDGLIRYTNADGTKMVVSEATNPDLYNQVSSDYDKAKVISDSKQEGYTLTDATYNGAPDFTKVGSPDEFGDGLIRFETASGDKFIVSQDINPDLYQAAVDAYTAFSNGETYIRE